MSNKYIIIRKKYAIIDVNVLHCVFDYCLPSCGGRGVTRQVILKKKIIFKIMKRTNLQTYKF